MNNPLYEELLQHFWKNGGLTVGQVMHKIPESDQQLCKEWAGKYLTSVSLFNHGTIT